MNHTRHQRILDFLKQEFNPDDTIHLLAVSAAEQLHDEYDLATTLKVRIALTFQEDASVNPYFDGTDLFVCMTETDIRFTKENEWADGPPLREGSPNELALGWVSELASPIFVSPEAQEAALRDKATSADTNDCGSETRNPKE
ncbi:hypothetical protein ABE504_26630 [Paenibacillus oryzisoli]|uniref:hypothetical protein n=1 Tax=Paenibacillus oryzisoli TaxID=1850517 RepID=UPI003D2D24A1